jgi:hypothetical protein
MTAHPAERGQPAGCRRTTHSIFRQLSAQEAQEETARLQASYPSAGELDWLNDLGDLMNEAINGAVQIFSYTVKATGNAIQATIHFAIDTAHYVYQITIKVIEEVFGLVETLFTWVQVAFEDLFNWLAKMFNWPKIRRTHQAVKYVMQQVGCRSFRERWAGCNRSSSRASNQSSSRLARGWWTPQPVCLAARTVRSSASSSSMAASLPFTRPPFGNNIVLDAFVEDLSTASVAPTENPPRAADDPIADLGNLFTNQAAQFRNSAARNGLQKYFDDQLQDQLADVVIKAPLEPLLEALQDPSRTGG